MKNKVLTWTIWTLFMLAVGTAYYAHFGFRGNPGHAGFSFDGR